MVENLSPGVHVVEAPSAVKAIAGVSASTAAFIGKVDDAAPFKMPLKPGSDTNRETVADTDKAVLVTNFEQFKKKFGDFQTGNKTLAHAVFGFFLNGGSRCYVVRVTELTDVTAALAELTKIDEVALVAAPGATTKATQEAIIDHCTQLQDRFAILDGQITTTITAEAIQGSTKTSNYAALYFPQIEVVNQTLAPKTGVEIEKWKPEPNARFFLPSSGHIAGVYARVDEARGVHKAPANEVVRGALNLEYLVTHNDQKELNPKGINVIRGFNGSLKVWGARTLGGDDNEDLKYINVRRTLLFLRESIDEGLQWAVFEPNTPALWQKISRNVTAFLTNVWRSGALFGSTPQQAFYVKCDEGLNPPEARDLGQVITEIGVAIVNPAEFVIFRISQFTAPSA
jgi:uncharacterized protein